MKDKKEDIGGGDMLPPGCKDIRKLIDNPFELPLLSVFLGNKKTMKAVLSSASIDVSGFGEFAILELSCNGSNVDKYRCNSKPVVDQVKKLLTKKDYGQDIFPVMVFPTVKENKTGQSYFSLLG